MTSSLENSVPVRQPRHGQVPSQRNQQIYVEYQTGQRQIDLAEKYKLTQTRISQIIRRVQKWLSPALDLGHGTLDSAAGDRLLHRIQYDRLNEAGRLAMQHFHEQQKIVTRKKGARAGKKFRETTERLLPPNLQCLKIVVQTSAQLTRLQASDGRRVGPGSGTAAKRWSASAGPPSLPRNVPCDDASDSATGHPHRGSNPQSAISNLTREQVEAWLTDLQLQAMRNGKVHVDNAGAPVISDVLKTLLGEPSTGFALEVLARSAGKRVVKRRPYEDKENRPPIPNRDGWYYGMYDANGGLVAWLHADQLAGAISPDYPPVSRSALDSSADDPNTSITPTSSTTPSTSDPPQPASAPALTAISPPTQFQAPYEPEPFDLASIQPSFYQKGCSN